MKKTVLCVVIGLGLAAVAAAQTIIVQSPNGGEGWTAGTEHPITWVLTGPTKASAMDIVLIKGTVELGLIAQNVPVSPTTYTWSVGQYSGGQAQPGTNYKVGIREIGTTELDASDAFFAIARKIPGAKPPLPPVTMKVNAPNGGEEWRVGSPRTISWSTANLTGKVKLELVREPNQDVGVIASNLPLDGSRPWNAGDYLGGRVSSGQYRVRVRSLARPTHFDDSDQAFTLTPSLPNMKPPHALPVQPVRIPAIVLNLSGTDSHPNVGARIEHENTNGRPTCDAPSNVRARVGRDWFAYQNVQLAALYRSRVHFDVGPYAARAGELTAARLRLKQVGSVRTGTTDASCGRSVCELLAPWTTFEAVQITNPRSLHHWESEYTVDITETVRKWLDGSLPNHGLALFAAELPMSNPWTCISCFEATFELDF